MSSFKDYHLKKELLEALNKINFVSPTPIQKLVIPRAIKGESLMVQSATGSGKTHAFWVPILQKLDASKNEVQVIIISPTRELASQLFNVVTDFTSKFPYEVAVSKVIGGGSRDTEIKKFEKNQPQIVIGTIGRLNDLVINANVLKIHNAATVVIDEADMIFEEKELVEVDKLIGKVQGRPQFLIFSATISKGLRQFLSKYLEKVEPITLEEKNLTTNNIEHIMLQCKAKDKKEVLNDLLKIINPYLAIIFVNTKEGVDDLALSLAEKGYKVGKLHGDMDDRGRKQMLKRINDLEFKYVVASDIAARGIDILGVSHIINFDLPKDIEFYIHRTGRTARYESTGIAYSLYAYDDDDYVKKLQAKGLKPKFYQIKNGELVETIFRKKVKRLSPAKQIEEAIHQKTPMPKKVKPGYRKKRKELIEKEIRKAKRERIQNIYRRRAKEERKNEDR